MGRHRPGGGIQEQETTDQSKDRLSNTESLILPSGAGADCQWSV